MQTEHQSPKSSSEILTPLRLNRWPTPCDYLNYLEKSPWINVRHTEIAFRSFSKLTITGSILADSEHPLHKNFTLSIYVRSGQAFGEVTILAKGQEAVELQKEEAPAERPSVDLSNQTNTDILSKNRTPSTPDSSTLKEILFPPNNNKTGIYVESASDPEGPLRLPPGRPSGLIELGGQVPVSEPFDKAYEPLPKNSSVSIPVKDVIPADLAEKLAKGEHVKLPGDVEAMYDEKYNVYRFYVGKGDGMSVVNLWLNKDKSSVEKINTDKDAYKDLNLSIIAKAGGIKPEVLNTVGIKKEDLEKIVAQQKADKEVLDQLQTGDLEKLPNSLKYAGTKENTTTVLQGQAVIADLKNNKEIQGLFTFGAGPCSILMLQSIGKDGKPEKIAMAHLDGATKPQDINALIAMLGDPKNVSATVISGQSDLALQVGNALKKSGVKTEFANVDVNGERSDQAIIDRNGKVYYGMRQDLVKVKNQEMDALVMQRMIAVGSQNPSIRLSIKRE